MGDGDLSSTETFLMRLRDGIFDTETILMNQIILRTVAVCFRQADACYNRLQTTGSFLSLFSYLVPYNPIPLSEQKISQRSEIFAEQERDLDSAYSQETLSVLWAFFPKYPG